MLNLKIKLKDYKKKSPSLFFLSRLILVTENLAIVSFLYKSRTYFFIDSINNSLILKLNSLHY